MRRPYSFSVLLVCSLFLAACSGGSAVPAPPLATETAGTLIATPAVAAPPPISTASIAPAPPPATSDEKPVAAVATTTPAPTPAAATQPAVDPPPEPAAPPPPPRRTPEQALRAEVVSWKKTPYREDGTTRKGIGNPGFVRAVFKGAFDVDIPSTIEQQMKTGKLVEQNALTAGDIVFFDGKGGFGPFAKPKIAGIVIGKDQVALADKDLGVTTVRLTEERWKSAYKTARRMPTDPSQAAPAFDAAAYGDNREALLRDVAKAWVGTLYLQGGKTFDGIGNDEFVRSIYEAIYDTELDGTPKTWETAGVAVKRAALQPGDIILYEAVGLGKFINQKHAGMYIGNGEFVHAVKGSAVTISKLKDPRWSEAFRSAADRPGRARASGRKTRRTGAAGSRPRRPALRYG